MDEVVKGNEDGVGLVGCGLNGGEGGEKYY